MFKGYLTFTMALVAVVVGILGLVFNWFGTQTSITFIWAGLATYGIRRALPNRK